MSKYQKIVDEIKKLFQDAPSEQKFETSADDLVISEMKVGGKVEAKDADGNLIPAEDGEYTIGTDVIEVKDGFITSLNGEKEAAPAEQMEEAPTEDKPKEDSSTEMQAQIDSMAKDIEGLKASIEELKTGMSAETENTNNFSKQIEDLTATIKTLIGMPAEFSKTNQSPVVVDAMEIKRAELAKVGMMLNKSKK